MTLDDDIALLATALRDAATTGCTWSITDRPEYDRQPTASWPAGVLVETGRRIITIVIEAPK